MTLYLGSTETTKLYLGSSEVDKIYLGSTQVFSKTVVGSSAPSIVGSYGLNTVSTLSGGATPTMPTGYSTGDLLLLFICSEGSYGGTGNSVDNGWTQLAYYGRANDTSYYSSVTVWYKVATSSSETAPTVTASSDPNGNDDLFVMAVTGFGGFGEVSGNQTNSLESSYSPPQVTSTVANCLVISCFNARVANDATSDATNKYYTDGVNRPRFEITFEELATASTSSLITYTGTNMYRPATVAFVIEPA